MDLPLEGESISWPSSTLIGLLNLSHHSRRFGARTTAILFNGYSKLKGLILAQNERWRHGLGMQVEREVRLRADGQRRKGE